MSNISLSFDPNQAKFIVYDERYLDIQGNLVYYFFWAVNFL